MGVLTNIKNHIIFIVSFSIITSLYNNQMAYADIQDYNHNQETKYSLTNMSLKYFNSLKENQEIFVENDYQETSISIAIGGNEVLESVDEYNNTQKLNSNLKTLDVISTETNSLANLKMIKEIGKKNQLEKEKELEANTYKITDEERTILARLAFLEAGGEGIDGMCRVLEVIKNRVQSDRFPDTIYEVVYAPKQFSPANRIASTKETADSLKAVSMVFDDGYDAVKGKPLFFWTIAADKYAYDDNKGSLTRFVYNDGAHIFYE